MNDASMLARLMWAKTDRDDPNRWHPLANHLVDVAAVALEMWETTIPATSRQRWTAWFGGDEDGAGAILALLAGVHDIGKASPVFQGASDEQRGRLATLGVSLRPQPNRSIPHGTISAGTLIDLMRERWPSLVRRDARRYAVLSGMHHGSLIDATTLRNATARRNSDQVGADAWERARLHLFDVVLEAIGDVPAPPPGTVPHGLATWAAGFISVADWIGSNTTYFPFDEPLTDPDMAFACSRKKARRALDELGWMYGRVAVPAKFEEAFRYKGWDVPNSTQRATIDAVRDMSGPGVAIVEAPMGDGKTEAGLWTAAHAERWWGTHGLYVAMPTRASSDQLFGRLQDHLAAHADGAKINLLLLHGHAAISAHLHLVQRQEHAFDPEPAASSPDSPDDVLLRAEWFSVRRRGLLAPYGVGTVDQTLLGVLENRHYFVRLHGLAGKTIIFDEVHAYDTYMETLFVRELEALGALGAPVVMLSATLPSERRDALLRAYARGAGWQPESDESPAPYPRVTTVDRHRIASWQIASSGRERTVALRWFTGAEDDARRRVVDALGGTLGGNGGTCAVICNTVGQAQAMFQLLEARFPGEVDLFHARFRHMDRADRQDRILGAFGKNRGTPKRRIVVATQVIEQSLDLDFDLMVSYFCPTDLLLQRLGRLHRHPSNDAKRPGGLESPQLWVVGVGDPTDETYPELGVPYVSRLIYDPHVLLRSWAVLRNRDRLTIPADIESGIEQTYGSQAVPPDDLADAWHRSAKELRDTTDKKARRAEGQMVPSLADDTIAGGTDPLIRNVAEKVAEDEQRQDLAAAAIARTRDGPPSVDVVLLTPEEDADIDPLAGDGATPLPLIKVAELLSRSVSISQRGPYRELIARDPPKAWQRTVWLQRHRLVELDDAGQAHIGRYRIELSPTLGVVIDHAGGPEEE